MSIQPKSVLTEVTKDRRAIEDRLYSSYVLDELATERLKRRLISAISSCDVAQRHQAAFRHELAYLLGVQGKYADALEQMKLAAGAFIDEKAIAFSSSYLSLINGQTSDARSILENASVVDESIEHKFLLAAHFVKAGMLESLVLTCDPNTLEFEDALEAAYMLREIGVNDIELTRRLDTAGRTIRNSIKHPLLEYRLFASRGEGILFRYVVKGTTGELVALNEKILDALMDEHDGPLDEMLSIGVVPWVAGSQYGTDEAYHVRLR